MNLLTRITHRTSIRHCGKGALAALLFASMTHTGYAADAAWLGATDGIWADPSNWSPAAAPGVVDALANNPDTATFSNATNTAVTVDANRAIGNVLFDTASAGAFTLQSGSLNLANGGSISIGADVVNSQTISSLVRFTNSTTSKTASFTNNATTSGVSLNVTGDVVGRNTGTLTLTVGGVGNTAISGNVSQESGSGTVAITKTGTGALTLSGTHSRSGATTLNGGTLNIGSASALGTGTFVLNTATADPGPPVVLFDTTFDNTSGADLTTANANAITLNGAGYTFTGTHALTFNGVAGSAGSGAVSVQSSKFFNLGNDLTFLGELRHANDGGSRIITVNGAGHTISFGGMAINTGGSGGRTAEFAGNAFVTINGEVRNGQGTQSLRYSGTSVLTLLGDNTYTGGTTINAGGTIQLGNGGTTGSFASSTTNGITNNGTLIVNRSNASSTAKLISGTGVLRVQGGGGAFTLGRAAGNTYSGGTIITAGSLIVANTSGSGTGTGAVSVSGAGTLGGGSGAGNGGTLAGIQGGASLENYTSGAGRITGAVTIGAGGHLAPGNSIGTLTVGSLTLNAGSFADYEFSLVANDYTIVTTSGGLSLMGGAFNLYQEGTTDPFAAVGTYNLVGYTGTLGGSLSNLSVANAQGGFSYTFSDTGSIVQLQIAVVPEPSISLLAAMSVCALMFGRRRSRVTLTR